MDTAIGGNGGNIGIDTKYVCLCKANVYITHTVCSFILICFFIIYVGYYHYYCHHQDDEIYSSSSLFQFVQI